MKGLLNIEDSYRRKVWTT